MITGQDALRHRLPAMATARESMMWSHCAPEEGLFINPYVWVDGEGVAGRALILAETGRVDALLLDIESGVALEEDFDAFSVAGLEVRQPQPLRRAEVSFESERCRLTFNYSTAHEAFDYESNEGGCPWYMASNRLEQSGTCEGLLQVDGREIAFAGPAHHDHSWGVRDWDAIQHYKWISAESDGSDIGLNVLLADHRGEQDLNGYLSRDGICSPVTAAEIHAEYDDDFFVSRAHARLTDAAGRTVAIETETYARFTFPVGADRVLLDSAARASIDGRSGIAQLDFLWPLAYAEHQRALAAAGIPER
jgi:hypothetical protein